MPKDPYIVLGIPRGAGIDEVKRAYRRLVLALHPDQSKSATGTEQLRDVQRAYETLQDPGSCDLQERATDEASVPAPEPLTYSRWRQEVRFRPFPFATPHAGLANRARRKFSELDELLGGVVPDVFPDRPSSLDKDLFVEVVLTEAEAKLGGTYPLTIPLQKQCHACLGSGLGSLTRHCSYCEGRGVHTHSKEFELVVPAGVHDRQETKLEVSSGDNPVILRVLVRVA